MWVSVWILGVQTGSDLASALTMTVRGGEASAHFDGVDVVMGGRIPACLHVLRPAETPCVHQHSRQGYDMGQCTYPSAGVQSAATFQFETLKPFAS